jgi:hypothetical protein
MYYRDVLFGMRGGGKVNQELPPGLGSGGRQSPRLSGKGEPCGLPALTLGRPLLSSLAMAAL